MYRASKNFFQDKLFFPCTQLLCEVKVFDQEKKTSSKKYIAGNFRVRHWLKSCARKGKSVWFSSAILETVVILFRNIPNAFAFIRGHLNVRRNIVGVVYVTSENKSYGW